MLTNGMYEYYGEISTKNGVTIHESEEDDFRSEFHRNRNRKGFKDTRLKRHYSEVIAAKVLDNYP